MGMTLARRTSAETVRVADRCGPRCGAILATGEPRARRASAFRWLSRLGGGIVATAGLITLPTSDTVILAALALLTLSWVISDDARTRRLARLVHELRENRESTRG